MISGILTCFLTPVIGAMIDFTPYRKCLGVFSASFITVAQATLIGTAESTWFFMALLLACNNFMLQIQAIAICSYLPEIARLVDDKTMATFNCRFTLMVFAAESFFVLTVIGISYNFELNEVDTSHVAQTLSAIVLAIGLTAWKLMPTAPANRKVASDKNLITAGFAQNWNTFKGINTYYHDGLKWFLISYCFGAAGVDAVVALSITYLSEVMGMNSKELVILSFIALIFAVPGAKLGSTLCKRYDPLIALKSFYIYFTCITIAGGFLLDRQERKSFSYGLGPVWGIGLGWYYPTVNLIFCQSLPKGQESEFSGFFLYCSQILQWLPSLIFTLMNEFGVPMNMGLMSLVIFYMLAFGFLSLMSPWSKIRQSAMEKSLIIRELEAGKAV